MIRKILALTALIAVPTFASSEARAEDYCREYTKTVSISGRAERAYGTACLRPDGSWEIVRLDGSDYARRKVRDVMYDDIEKYSNRRDHRDYRDRDRVVIVENYNHSPRYYKRGHHRYNHVAYNSWPFAFYFGNNHSYNHKKHYGHTKKHYKNHYKHDKHHYKYSHHGKGHGKGHKKGYKH